MIIKKTPWIHLQGSTLNYIIANPGDWAILVRHTVSFKSCFSFEHQHDNDISDIFIAVCHHMCIAVYRFTCFCPCSHHPWHTGNLSHSQLCIFCLVSSWTSYTVNCMVRSSFIQTFICEIHSGCFMNHWLAYFQYSIVFRSMIKLQLIHVTLGWYLHLYSLKLSRIILAHTWCARVWIPGEYPRGRAAASQTMCVFSFSRWMLNRFLGYLVPVCALSVVPRGLLFHLCTIMQCCQGSVCLYNM